MPSEGFGFRKAFLKERVKKMSNDVKNTVRTDEDIEKLLASLTLEEKVGQLVQWNAAALISTEAEMTGPQVEAGKEAGREMSSVLNFTGAEEAIRMQKKYLQQDPHGIPLLMMQDVVHGYRTIYPIPLAMGGSFDPELMAECCEMAAREAVSGGVHLTFAPMVDHVRDLRWGRVMESCGEDPLVNSVMGAAQVKAFQGDDPADRNHLAACVKHYAAYGAGEGGRDYNEVSLPERTLREWYFPAFKACIDVGVASIMPSFNSLNGLPSVANPWLMKDVLKDEWKFDGLVISDYNALGELVTQGVAQDLKDAAAQGYACGCDIDMVSGAYSCRLAELIREGKCPEEPLNDAVRKVLKLKRDLGLFEDPYRGASPEKEAETCLTAESRALVRKAAEEAAVLLKNAGILPLKKEIKKLALIGPFADEKDLIGAWSCHGQAAQTVSVLEGIRALLPETEITVVRGCGTELKNRDGSGISGAVEAATKAEAVILCLGEPGEYSGEGHSRGVPDLPGAQLELARQVLAVKPETPVVLFNGRPLLLKELDEIAPAILEMWYPGSEAGNAVAALVFGDAVPCGKTAMSFPKSIGQVPLSYTRSNTGRPKPGSEEEFTGYASNYMDCGNLALYPFGWGLSYTDFRYDSLELSSDVMTAEKPLTVTVTLTNTGDRKAKEVVQLYLNDVVSSVVTPVQKLADFKKVELAPGETRKVGFTLLPEKLTLWDLKGQARVEPGTFEVSAGCADHLILTQKFDFE